MKQVIQVARPEQRLMGRSPPGVSARFPSLSFFVVDMALGEIQRAAYAALIGRAMDEGGGPSTSATGAEACAALDRSRAETPHVEICFDPRTQDFVQVCACGVEQRIVFAGSLDAQGAWVGVEPGLARQILPAWCAFRADHRACAPAAADPPTAGASILAAPDYPIARVRRDRG